MFKKITTHGSAITPRENHRTIVFKDILYVLMGYDGSTLGDMYWTKDGRNWNKRSSIKDTNGNVIEGRSLFGLCKHNNKVYLFGGYNKKNDVYVTSDMTHWRRLKDAPWSGRHAFINFSFQGKLWVMGGYDGQYLNEVWWTRDGVDWTQEPNAPWDACGYNSGVVCGNKIYIAGGYSGLGVYFRDVWSTSDCKNWEKANIIGEKYQARYKHSLITDGSRIILTGGSASTTYYNDIWHTPNGINWYNSGPFVGEITGHSVVYFNNRYLIFCGKNGSGYLNDIWETRDGKLKIK